jgi:L-asparaginase / beta-aspartyl-peptidase
MPRVKERLVWLLVFVVFMSAAQVQSQNQARESNQKLEHQNPGGLFVMKTQNFGFAIHGGAGTILRAEMKPELEKEYRAKLNEALLAGYQILKTGGSSLDAVEAAIRIMEDSPLFNAGKGAVYTNEGTIELDASIMDGKTLKAGAIAAVKHIKNPVSVARLVMEQSQHVLMVGDGAEAFAKQKGVELVSAEYFQTQRRWDELQRVKDKEKQQSAEPTKIGGDLGSEPPSVSAFGTVGAVALDKQGNLAAATSTGGKTNKKFGRVGDSPIIGAGTYANNKTCAVSGTGDGEYFIRGVVAYDISALMEYNGKSLDEAARIVIDKIGKLGGTGGIIAIDFNGTIVMPFNTKGMYRGYIGIDGKPTIQIYGN